MRPAMAWVITLFAAPLFGWPVVWTATCGSLSILGLLT